MAVRYAEELQTGLKSRLDSWVDISKESTGVYIWRGKEKVCRQRKPAFGKIELHMPHGPGVFPHSRFTRVGPCHLGEGTLMHVHSGERAENVMVAPARADTRRPFWGPDQVVTKESCGPTNWPPCTLHTLSCQYYNHATTVCCGLSTGHHCEPQASPRSAQAVMSNLAIIAANMCMQEPWRGKTHSQVLVKRPHSFVHGWGNWIGASWKL
jgi:hypothetical protein